MMIDRRRQEKLIGSLCLSGIKDKYETIRFPPETPVCFCVYVLHVFVCALTPDLGPSNPMKAELTDGFDELLGSRTHTVPLRRNEVVGVRRKNEQISFCRAREYKVPYPRQ